MADCPQDDEIDRPQNMMEMVSGDESWKEVGLRVKWTDPPLPSKRNLVAGEPILVYMAIEAKKDVSDSEHDIGAFCWTNTSFVENRCTTWKDIKMFENTNCRDEETPGIVTHIYQGSLAPSLENIYRLTFNVKWKQFMIWAGQYQVDSIIYVSQSSGKNINIQVPVNFPTRYPFSQEDVRCETVPDPLQFKPDGDYTRARAPSKALSKTRASSRSLVTPEGDPENQEDQYIEVKIQELDLSNTIDNASRDENLTEKDSSSFYGDENLTEKHGGDSEENLRLEEERKEKEKEEEERKENEKEEEERKGKEKEEKWRKDKRRKPSRHSLQRLSISSKKSPKRGSVSSKADSDDDIKEKQKDGKKKKKKAKGKRFDDDDEERRSSTKPKASANEFRDVELMRGAAAAEEAEIQEGQPAEDEVDVQAVTRQSESGAGVEYEVLTQEETGDQEPAEVEEKVAAGEEEEEEEKVAAEEWEEEMDADEELKKKLANEEDVELLVML